MQPDQLASSVVLTMKQALAPRDARIVALESRLAVIESAGAEAGRDMARVDERVKLLADARAEPIAESSQLREIKAENVSLRAEMVAMRASFDAQLESLKALVVVPGPPGERGPQGQDGQLGRDGIAGRDGLPGVPGATGLPGEKGLDGVHGKDGLNGKDGADGLGLMTSRRRSRMVGAS
jgi:hypothetical protein